MEDIKHDKMALRIRAVYNINLQKCEICNEDLGLQQIPGTWQYCKNEPADLFTSGCCYPYDIEKKVSYHTACVKLCFADCKEHTSTEMHQGSDGLFYECFCMVEKKQKLLKTLIKDEFP